MKKLIVFTSLLFSIHLFAQDNTTQDNTIITSAKPAITEIGKPDGEKTEMKIGKEGGSFTSSDGRVRLIFPEGALSKKTTISIQPVANLAPNGNGKAYRMEPSGIKFPKPVKIIFKYTNDETDGNSADLLGLAVQDEKGLWSSLNNAIIDTQAKTLTSEIRHFSYYVNYMKAKIDPSSAKVKVNGSVRLKISAVYPQVVTGDEDVLTTLGTEIRDPVWSANGTPGGNSITGSISSSQNFSAIYQAPAQVPEQNPVAVSVDFKVSKTFKLVSNITVYNDAWEVKMVAVLLGGSKDVWGGFVTYWDEGSFIVSLENNKPAILNIKNQLEVVKYSTCPDRSILNPTTCTGLLHVAGAKQIKLTPANPPSQPDPIVEIWFIPHPVELTTFTFNCPPPPGADPAWSKGSVNISHAPMFLFMSMPALPPSIKFIAKEGEQTILEKRSPKGEFYYKFSVQKIKKD